MKRICAFLSAAILCLTVITISYAAVPSFSATQWCVPPTGFGGGSRVIPTDTIVSYSDLRDYRTAVNKWLSEGQYSGFHGTASLTYTGSFYFIQLVQDGNVYWLCNGSGGRYRTETESSASDSATTTAPSTTAPSASKDEGTDRDSTYVSDPTAPSDSTTELNALNRLVKAVYTQIKSIHGLWRVNINMYNIQIKLRRLMWDTIDGINNVTTGIYKQVDLLTGYLPRLDDIYNRLFNIQSASWASVDVENRIYSAVVGLGSRLDSVIKNGAVQINTTSIDTRLDKLISMYSKVNSVVLDTASVNGGQITGAVGGELQDVVFWGSSRRVYPRLYSASVNYTLNGETAQYQLVAPDGSPILLRMVALGSSIPSYIADDPVLSAGVWHTGTSYVISDTCNFTTGVYTQRIKEYVFTGNESDLGVRSRANGSVLFWRNYTGDAQLAVRSSHFTFIDSNSAISPGGSTDLSITHNTCTYYNGRFALASTSLTTLEQWRTWLADQYTAGTPVTMYYVDGPASGWTSVPVSVGIGQTVPIPEGNSLISADLLRITGKYETYESFTQTADIITAINNIPPYDDSGLIAAITGMTTPTVTTDLTAVTSRLDLILAELQSSSGSASCERTYEDHTGDGAPDEDYSDTTISKLVVKVFSKLGTFAGKLIGFFVHLLDKALTSVDNVISKFNDYTAQISGFGGSYTTWLTGLWGIIPAELQIALTFSVICMALGAVGKKLLFS